jgi:polysaccharide export outer membrane protein
MKQSAVAWQGRWVGLARSFFFVLIIASAISPPWLRAQAVPFAAASGDGTSSSSSLAGGSGGLAATSASASAGATDAAGIASGPASPGVGSVGPSVAAGGGSESTASVLKGTGVSPSEAAAMARNLSPAETNAIAASVGMSPGEINSLRTSTGSGGLSSAQLETISAHLATAGVSTQEVNAIGHALGLSAAQMSQVHQNLNQIQRGTSLTAPGQHPAGSALANMSNDASATYQNAGTTVFSPIESEFRTIDTLTGQVPQFTGPENLLQFGYEFFDSPAARALNPEQNAPVGSDYIVGPGDQLQLLVWGTRNETVALTVARDGAIQIPAVGPVQVAGLRFSDAKKLIEGRVQRITGVHAAVTMGQIRTITVFVVGEVKAPGPYTVTALARVSDALVAAGGPTKIGSLRKVELKRDNQLIAVVDLYSILLDGNTATDQRLADHDAIFVPTIGPVAAIAGDVKRPAIYELKSSRQSLASLFSLAGGIDPFAYTQRIQIERVENHKRRIILDSPLSKVAIDQMKVSDGDLIKIFPVLPDQKNKVTLLGNVFRPGDYQWHPGMKLSDLITLGEGVEPRTYFRYALVKRLEGKQLYPHYLPVDLSRALEHPDSAANLDLQVYDTLTVYNQDSLRQLPTVTVIGQIRNPGIYRLDPNMRVSDLIYLAGGLTDRAYLKVAQVARTRVVDGATTRHSYMDVDLRKALHGEQSDDIELEPNDQVFVRTATNWHLPWTVTVSGRVARPGVYSIHPNERLSSVLLECGGMLPDAFPPGIVFTRASIRAAEQQELSRAREQLQMQVAQVSLVHAQLAASAPGASSPQDRSAQMASLQQLLSAGTATQATGRLVIHFTGQELSPHDDVVLEMGDTIDVPRRPSSVNVLGQVYNPTSIVVRPNLTIRDYVELAGGPTQLADPEHLMVVKADGEVLTAQGFDDQRRNQMFPMLPLFSGGLEDARLGVGDTVYIPNKIPDFTKLQVTQSVTSIIAQSAQSLAVLGLLASSL